MFLGSSESIDKLHALAADRNVDGKELRLDREVKAEACASH